MRLALPRLHGPRAWIGLAAALVAVTAIIAARRLAPDGQPAAPPPSLASADPSIRLVQAEGAALDVYADLTGAKDIAGNFDKAAAVVQAVGEALQRGVSDELKGARTVRFTFRCEAVNRFGENLMAPLVTLDLPLAALKEADYGRARPADLLARTTMLKMGAPGAYDALDAWCADPKRSSAAFCALPRSAA